MTFLPIVERELRVAARRSGTYWLRVGAGLMAIVICFWMLLSLSAVLPTPSMGARLFRALSLLAFIYCLLAGIRLTSDCLSEEKREGTLGLLFLTDLKGYDVVLGKMAATSLKALYGLLSILPVLAIPILMGGVTLGDLWRVSLILLNTLFFSLAGGIFISAISRLERKAVEGTFLLMLLSVFGPMILVAGGTLFTTWNRFPALLFLADPAFPFMLTISPNPAVSGGWVILCSTLLVHGLGWFFLALASRIAPQVWKDKVATAKAATRQKKLRRLLEGNEMERKALRARMLAVNPIFWLSSRHSQERFYPWLFLGAMILIWLPGYAQMKSWWLVKESALLFLIAMHLVFKLWLATQASSSFALDREKGALELLFSTPLKTHEMVGGQWMALWRQFARPVLAILALDLLLMWGALANQRDSHTFWLLFFLGQMVMFVADLIALGWVGMWMGVKSKSASRAAFATIGRILLLPWAPLVMLWGMILSASFARGTSNWNWEEVLNVIWFCLGIVIDVVFGVRACQNLRHNLRATATERFERHRARLQESKV